MTVVGKDIAVLKFGSELVTHNHSGQINHEAIDGYADQIAQVDDHYHPMVITSGAVLAGKAYYDSMGIDRTEFDEQQLAAAGSDEISKAWKDALAARNIAAGQLLTIHSQMRTGSVLMRGLLRGMANGMVYIGNENDQENIFELKRLQEHGRRITKAEKNPGVENDKLASLAAIAISHEISEEAREGIIFRAGDPESRKPQVHLVLFTEVGGLMVNKAIQPEIRSSNKEHWLNKCEGVGEGGTGGMRFKLEAAFDAVKHGIATTIASPKQEFVDILEAKGSKGVPIATRVLQ